jgi:agarase
LSFSQVQVNFNVNVKHIVGGIESFDRSKFITIHANQAEGEWDGDNFTSDLRDIFLNGLDVYLGRDTGGITWNLNNMEEDPLRSGYADPVKIASKGTNSRNSFASKTNLHQYENRKSHVVGAQLHPFWTGESQVATKKGWKLANATAVGEYMGKYFNSFHGGNGQKSPDWVEIMNEPAYEALGGKKNYTNSLQEIADFHVEVADAIRVENSNLKIGGYTVAFPDFETGDFQRWINRDKLFIDVAGEKMDFWSWHLYDFPSIGGKTQLRSGSNVEATFDMNDHYSMLKLGHKKPYVISEYGAQTHDYNNQGWLPYKDWLFLKAQNSLMMSFMERPDDIAIAIPFTIVKAEWGFNQTKNLPYGARLLRKTNEPTSYTGQWVYTNRVKFYELWQNVKGTRVDTTTDDLDIQVDAYVDGNKAYLILNNLHFQETTINLSLFDSKKENISSIRKKHLTLINQIPVLEDENIATDSKTVKLGAEATMILEYTFDNNVTIDETSNEKKYFATSYFKPIVANQPNLFEIKDVVKNTYGEAILRVGLGRDHGKSLQPTIKINGTEINVPTDYRGYDQADKDRFFGLLEIPVPFGLIQEKNTISVSFSDNGGHVSSMGLQVFNFSSNIREFDVTDISNKNFKIKTTATTCKGSDNGSITITPLEQLSYKVVITGTNYAKNLDFSNNIEVSNLKPGFYDLKITIPEFPDFEKEFSLEIHEAENLNVSSKINQKKNNIELNLSGSEIYYINVNGEQIETANSNLVLPLKNGINKLTISGDKDCQEAVDTTFNFDYRININPNPAKEKIAFQLPQNIKSATASIYSSNGGLIQKTKITQNMQEINTTQLKTGLYLIKITNENNLNLYSKFLIN